MESIIVLDNKGIIIVSEEKEALAREVIKHYAPIWREENPNGSAVHLASTIFKKLRLEHQAMEDVHILPVNVFESSGQHQSGVNAEITGLEDPSMSMYPDDNTEGDVE